jgi:trans-aconitate 2-methyltransferase
MAAGKWNPARYQQFAAERLRPALDLMARLPKLSAAQPAIADVGCGSGGPAKLLLQRFPSAKLLLIDSSPEMLEVARSDSALQGRQMVSFHCERFEEHFSAQAGVDGPLYDCVFSNAALHWSTDVPSLLCQILERVRPGGVLAMQIPDTRSQASHVLMRELAADFGLAADDVALRSNRNSPQEYAETLVGPLCNDLDMWSTTYVHQLAPGESPVHDFVRFDGLRPVLDALGGEGTEAAVAFEDAYRRRVADLYPPTSDGTTFFPFTRFFLVAKRPSLLDVYQEYSAYHDHQLTKGWKS